MSRAVLITSAGRRVGLMKAVRESLAELGLNWRVIAADAAPDFSAACHLADASHKVPPIASADYVGALLEICGKEDVALVIPTIDPELVPLAEHEPDFAAEGIRLNIGSPEFVGIARDKQLTARRLGDLGIAVPHTLPAEVAEGELTFPLIAKPVGGSSSIGITRYRSATEYRANPPAPDCILQQLVEGPEYTVNVFCDAGGTFRAAVPHLRIEVRSGEVSKGRTERRGDLAEIARKIAGLPGARGAFCFQAILTERGPVAFEINARFGGGYPLAHRAGATFTRWLLEETAGLPSSANDEWQDGLLLLRYDSGVFVQ